jgi:hypothetical protein
MIDEGCLQDVVAFDQEVSGLAGMDTGRGHQGDARVVVFVVI